MTSCELVKFSLPEALLAYEACPATSTPISLHLGEHVNFLLRKVSKDQMPWGHVTTTENRITISMRGTQTLAEWAEDLNAPLTAFWHENSHVHAGFCQLYSALVPNFIALPVSLHKEIVVIGHSLGAAIATLLAAELAFFHSDNLVYLCTFESPRVGNRAFKRFVDGLPNLHVARVANRHDCVTTKPDKFLFTHVGNVYLFDGPRFPPQKAHSLITACVPAVDLLTPTVPFIESD